MMRLKMRGQMFETLLAHVSEREPELLETATAEMFLLEGREPKPYSRPEIVP
jgi:hypothetical protein